MLIIANEKSISVLNITIQDTLHKVKTSTQSSFVFSHILLLQYDIVQ